MWYIIFMIFKEFDTLIFIKDILIYGAVVLITTIALIIYFKDKKKEIEQKEDKEFEEFCRNIPELQDLIALRDLYLYELMTLYTDLSSIQEVYNFVVKFKKSVPPNYYPTELNKIEAYLEKRYKQVYILFKQTKENALSYQKAVSDCYASLRGLIEEEKKNGKRDETTID